MKETIGNSETTFEKGIGLEKEFATFLKTDLGWEKTRNRKQMRSKWNMSGTNVDIIAEKLTEHGQHMYRVADAYIKVSVLIVILGILSLFYEETLGISVIIIGFVFMVFAFVFRARGDAKRVEHAWVECKSQKGKSTIKQMQIMVAERDSYIESNDKEFAISTTYFASKNGFVETAIKYAQDKEVECYQKSGNTFEKVNYWN